MLSLLKEYLPKIDVEEIEKLANNIFQEKLYDIRNGTDSTFHQKELQYEYASGNFGVKIFNSIDIELIELLYVVGGINLNKYKEFINS